MVAEGGIVRVLLHGHELDGVVAQPGYPRQHTVCAPQHTAGLSRAAALGTTSDGACAVRHRMQGLPVAMAADCRAGMHMGDSRPPTGSFRSGTFEVGVGGDAALLGAHAHMCFVDAQALGPSGRPLMLPGRGSRTSGFHCRTFGCVCSKPPKRVTSRLPQNVVPAHAGMPAHTCCCPASRGRRAPSFLPGRVWHVHAGHAPPAGILAATQGHRAHQRCRWSAGGSQ